MTSKTWLWSTAVCVWAEGCPHAASMALTPPEIAQPGPQCSGEEPLCVILPGQHWPKLARACCSPVCQQIAWVQPWSKAQLLWAKAELQPAARKGGDGLTGLSGFMPTLRFWPPWGLRSYPCWNENFLLILKKFKCFLHSNSTAVSLGSLPYLGVSHQLESKTALISIVPSHSRQLWVNLLMF